MLEQPHRPPGSTVALTRRRLLAGILVGTAVVGSGCTAEGTDGPRRSRSRRPAPAADQDPDVLLATAAVRDLRTALAVLTATASRHALLAPRLRAVETTHSQHLRVLDDAVPERADSGPGDPATSPDDAGTSPSTTAPGPRAPATVPRRRGAALRAVVTAEQELSTALRRHAFAAESGPFSRLLASMAASAAQHAAELDEVAGPRGRGGDA